MRFRKDRLSFVSGVVSAALIIFPPVSLPSQVPKQTIDIGRISLLRAEPKKGGMLVNQKDGVEVDSFNLSFVKGRSRFRKAVYVSIDGWIKLPTNGNFSYHEGSVAFWIKSDIWNDDIPRERVFFRVDANSLVNPSKIADFMIKKHPDSLGKDYIFVNIGVNKISYLSEAVDPSNWHLLIVTYKTGELFNLYFDGIIAGTSPWVFNGALPASGRCNFQICWGSWGGIKGAESLMEDMQTFDYALSEEQIGEMYDSQSPANYYSIGRGN